MLHAACYIRRATAAGPRGCLPTAQNTRHTLATLAGVNSLHGLSGSSWTTYH